MLSSGDHEPREVWHWRARALLYLVLLIACVVGFFATLLWTCRADAGNVSPIDYGGAVQRSPQLRVIDGGQTEARRVAEAQLAALFERDYREHWEPSCVLCERPASKHAEPVVVGGEEIVPACELLHPGGLLPEGPAPPLGPRPLSRRLGLALGMTRFYAETIAGTLGEPSKMPGPSYGLDAWQCQVGGILSDIPGSTCNGCYAKKNFYRHYWPAKKARHRRMAAIRHPLWTEAMIALVLHHLHKGGEPYFRWHDSGDLQSLNHFENICAVAEAVPKVAFWLPTREYGIVAQHLREGGAIPPNLAVRLSSHWNGEAPRVPPILAHLPTSTVHLRRGDPVRVGPRRNSTVECRAGLRDTLAVDGDLATGFCGDCRACWTTQVQNVSYPKH